MSPAVRPERGRYQPRCTTCGRLSVYDPCRQCDPPEGPSPRIAELRQVELKHGWAAQALIETPTIDDEDQEDDD